MTEPNNNIQENETPVTTAENPASKTDTTPMSASALKELQGLVKELNDTFTTMESMTKQYFDTAGVGFDSLSVIEKLIKSSDHHGDITFPLVTEPESSYPTITVDDGDIRQVLGEVYAENDDVANRNKFDELYKMSVQYISIRDQLIGVQAEYRAEVQKQYAYLTSPEYAKEMEDRLNAMKDRYANETDEDAKKALERAISAIESMNSMDYIFKRLEGEGANKEIKTIASSFFEYHGSSYVVNKFLAKAKKIGIGGNLYLNCLNIETRFLDELYHPFNNLFLFSMVRLIAYIDVYNKEDVMFAKNTMRMLLRLMNHAFPSTDAEQAFVNVIKTYLDHFMPLRDKFIKENDSYIKYMESINAPDRICGEYLDDINAEFANSRLSFFIQDDDNKTHIISEIKGETGIKLFADGRPIVRPNEVPEDYRDKLAILGQNDECMTINFPVSKMSEFFNQVSQTPNRARVPSKEIEDAHAEARINISGFKSVGVKLAWPDAAHNTANVYVDSKMNVWVEHWFVVNSHYAGEPWLKDVWFATRDGDLIHTNIPAEGLWKALDSKLSRSDTRDGDGATDEANNS